MRIIGRLTWLLILLFMLSSCTAHQPNETITPASTFTATPSPAPTPTVAPTPQPTPTPTPTPTPHPHAKYFSKEETAFFGENKWRYTSPDLSVFIEKIYMEDVKCWVYIAEIFTKDGVLPFVGHAGRIPPGDGKLKKPKDIAREYGTVYAQNGDFFWEEHNNFSGIIIRGGEVYKKKIKRDMLAIYPDGSFRVYEKDEITVEELLAEGVKDTFSFGPILVRDGEVNQKVEEHELKGRYPRSAIGMVSPGHYFGILVDGRQPNVSIGMRLLRLAEEFQKRGCSVAYNLDGGQSTGMVFLGMALNSHVNDQPFPNQRRVPEVLCFGETTLTPYGDHSLDKFASLFASFERLPESERCR